MIQNITSTISRTLLFVSFLLLFFTFSSPITSAVDLASLQTVSHGGVVISKGDTITRADLTTVSTAWGFFFTWPNAVANNQTFLGIFLGTFGDIEGVVPVSGSNYGSAEQQWFSGSNSLGKFIGIPPLGDGTSDVIIEAGEEQDSLVSMGVLIGSMETMDIQHGLKNELIEKLKKAQKELTKGREEKTVKKLEDFVKKLEKEIKENLKQIENKLKISTEDAERLIIIIEEIINGVV